MRDKIILVTVFCVMTIVLLFAFTYNCYMIANDYIQEVQELTHE